MTNLPTIEEIAANPGVLAHLTLDTLDAILSQADDYSKRGVAAKKAVQGLIEDRYGDEIATEYRRQDKDTGTVRVAASDGYEVVADRAKTVEWDQTALAAAGDKISAEGDDPHEYLEVTYKVQERKYAAWPQHIRTVFEPARTLRPGALSIKLVKVGHHARQEAA